MGHFPDSGANLGAHFFDGAPRQRLLHVDAAIEEHLFAELAFLGRRIGVPRHFRRQAVIAVDAAGYKMAHEGLGDRATAVELDFPLGILLEIVFLCLLDAAHIVRHQLILEHLERKECGLFAGQVLGAHAQPVDIFAALIEKRLV